MLHSSSLKHEIVVIFPSEKQLLGKDMQKYTYFKEYNHLNFKYLDSTIHFNITSKIWKGRMEKWGGERF